MFILLLFLLARDCEQSYCGSLYQCDSCVQNYTLIAYNNTKCVKQCDQIHQYQSELFHICQDCDQSCIGCLGSLQIHCLNCSDSTKLLQNGICVISCSSGYYTNQYQCSLCDKTCNTCVNSSITCTSCIGDRYLVLFNSTCVQKCPQSFYMDSTLNLCVQICPPSYFINLTSQACQRCTHRCSNCMPDININNTQYYGLCQKCQQSYFLYQNQCTLTCPTDLYANKYNYVWQCTDYLKFTIYALSFQSPLRSQLDGDDIITQLRQIQNLFRYFILKFSEPIVDTNFQNITQLQLSSSLNITFNNQSAYRFFIEDFSDGNALHFQMSLIDFYGYIVITTTFLNQSFRGNITGSPLSPQTFTNGISQNFQGFFYINFKYSRQNDWYYVISGQLFVYTLITVLGVSLLYKAFLDPKNYMFFTFFNNMQILAMLIFIDFPRYQYLTIPFEILQMWFNLAINASFHQSINYQTNQLYQFGFSVPIDDYAPTAMQSAYNYFFVDYFLGNVFTLLKDYQMSVNYLANFFFYFGIILIVLDIIMVIFKYLIKVTYREQEQVEKQQKIRKQLTKYYKIIRIVTIRVYQSLILNNYFFMLLQLAHPNFSNLFSAVSFIMTVMIFFIQIWILIYFQKKMRKITDYQENSSSFQEFILDYSIFFSSLRVSFNYDLSEQIDEKLIDKQRQEEAEKQAQQDTIQISMETLANQKLNYQVEKIDDSQMNTIIEQEEAVVRKQLELYQKQLQNYYLILTFHMTNHCRMVTMCLLLVFLQYWETQTLYLLGCFILMNGAMIYYYAVKKPLKDQAANYHQIFFESSMASITICFIYLSIIFDKITSYIEIPQSEQDKLNVTVGVILFILFAQLVAYLFTMIVVSIPYLKKTVLRKKAPIAEATKPKLQTFDPSSGGRIPIQGMVKFDNQRVKQQQIELGQQFVSRNIVNNYGMMGIEVVPDTHQEKLKRVMDIEENNRIQAKIQRSIEKQYQIDDQTYKIY